MKITADAKALGDVISWGSKGVSRVGKSVNESTVVAQVSNRSMTLFSFDGSAYFSATVPVVTDSDEDVTFRVFGPQLANAAKLLKKGEVIIEVAAKKVTLSFGASRFDFPQVSSTVMPPPNLPAAVGTINVTELRQVANHAISVTSSDYTTPALSAVLVELKPHEAQALFEATDRYRMVIRSAIYAPNHDSEDDIAVIVPANELKRLLSDIPASNDIEIHAGGSFFGVSGSGFAGYVNIFDTPPIAYHRMLEQPFPTRVIVNREEFREAVGNVAMMSKPGSRIILVIEGEEITITNSDGDSETRVSVQIEDDNGGEGPWHIALNPAFLVSALAAAKSDDLSFSFSSTTSKPILFHEVTASGTDDESYNHIIMPTR